MSNTDPSVQVIQTISVLGCGWYGLALAKKLISSGYSVKGSSTTAEKLPILSDAGIQPYLIDFQEDTAQYDPDFFHTDLLLISIPPKRSSGAQQAFYKKITGIAGAAQKQQVKHVIFISSTAVYGDHNTEVTELSTPQPDTASGIAMLEAEKLLMGQSTFSSTVLRFGGLIGPGRNPGRFFAGKQDIPNGQAPVNLVHLTDCLNFSLSLIKNAAFGHIYNVCSTDHPSRQDFYSKAAEVSALPIPAFIDELLQWKRVSTIHIAPKFHYQYLISNFSTWMDTDKL
ncbi:NAD(P)-dependent oxidoreductase [Pedobacter sp. KBW06]|uniref:SDR family oxidoreductase n=1 Tax=Pedobacter sp. KBW06 TaxID=2153359 RepID=UPI000F59F96D|nr:SDR family oxidoreductase [Pedobacter sp. KBW06]RQO69638.1 NAD(P)-dependent oxidoreductase [Pedobacter sp. KBW06]